MSDTPEPLRTIRALIEQKRYRIRIHAVQHMIKEGFSEDDIVQVLRSGRLLENYHEEARCLILGLFTTAGSSLAHFMYFVTTQTKIPSISRRPTFRRNHGGKQKQNEDESIKSADAKSLH